MVLCGHIGGIRGAQREGRRCVNQLRLDTRYVKLTERWDLILPETTPNQFIVFSRHQRY